MDTNREDSRRELEAYYNGLSPDERRERILLQPAFRDAYNEITQAHQVVQLPRYFWDKWVPLLGPTTTAVYVNLRKHCYYNSRTGEMRDNWETRQETLAWECGIKDRKTLRKCLVVLETHGFIRRTPNHMVDPRTKRAYRTTDLYQVFYEVPLVDEDAVELLLRRVDLAATDAPDPVMRKVSPLHSEAAQAAVENHLEEGKYSPSPRENVPSKREYSDVLNERNVGFAHTKTQPGNNGPMSVARLLPRTFRHRHPTKQKHLSDVLPKIQTSPEQRDRLLRVEDLGEQIASQLGDSRSQVFYRKVARRFLEAGREQLIYRALSDIKEGQRNGTLHNPPAVFTARVKELAAMNGIEL